MKKETLSDKIRTDIVVAQDTGGLLKADDVKQFIKDLKEKTSLFCLEDTKENRELVKEFNEKKNKIIDKLAGKKLI